MKHLVFIKTNVCTVTKLWVFFFIVLCIDGRLSVLGGQVSLHRAADRIYLAAAIWQGMAGYGKVWQGMAG